MRVSTQITLVLCWISPVAGVLSYEECRADDFLFINPRVSLEINDSSSSGSEFIKTIKSPSESHYLSKCKNIFDCKSAISLAKQVTRDVCWKTRTDSVFKIGSKSQLGNILRKLTVVLWWHAKGDELLEWLKVQSIVKMSWTKGGNKMSFFSYSTLVKIHTAP